MHSPTAIGLVPPSGLAKAMRRLAVSSAQTSSGENWRASDAVVSGAGRFNPPPVAARTGAAQRGVGFARRLPSRSSSSNSPDSSVVDSSTISAINVGSRASSSASVFTTLRVKARRASLWKPFSGPPPLTAAPPRPPPRPSGDACVDRRRVLFVLAVALCRGISCICPSCRVISSACCCGNVATSRTSVCAIVYDSGWPSLRACCAARSRRGVVVCAWRGALSCARVRPGVWSCPCPWAVVTSDPAHSPAPVPVVPPVPVVESASVPMLAASSAAAGGTSSPPLVAPAVAPSAAAGADPTYQPPPATSAGLSSAEVQSARASPPDAPAPPPAAATAPPPTVQAGPAPAPLAPVPPAQCPSSPGRRQHRPHSPAPRDERETSRRRHDSPRRHGSQANWAAPRGGRGGWWGGRGRGGGWVYDQPVTMADLHRVVSDAMREERNGRASLSNSPRHAHAPVSHPPPAPYAPAPLLPSTAAPPPRAPATSAAAHGNRLRLPWVPPVAGVEFVTAGGVPVTPQYPSLLPVAPDPPAADLPVQSLVGPCPSADVPEASRGQLWRLAEGLRAVHLIQVYCHAALSRGVPLAGGPLDECSDAADRLAELLAPVLAAPARGGVAGVGQLGTALRAAGGGSLAAPFALPVGAEEPFQFLAEALQPPQTRVPEATLGQLHRLADSLHALLLIQVLAHSSLPVIPPETFRARQRDPCLDAADQLAVLLAPVLAAPAEGGAAAAGQLDEAVRGLRRHLRAGSGAAAIGASTLVVRELWRSLTGILHALGAHRM
ncbi:unnamed protein product [Closterium sp. Naga37s-1]|nr:unnamed protein product [Closterium sp. Naga37s-1]